MSFIGARNHLNLPGWAIAGPVAGGAVERVEKVCLHLVRYKRAPATGRGVPFEKTDFAPRWETGLQKIPMAAAAGDTR